MRVRTWSACVALAWGIVLIMAAAGPLGSAGQAQATTRIAGITSSTSVTSRTSVTSSTSTTSETIIEAAPAAGAATIRAAATSRQAGRTMTAGGPAATAARYVVQPGDTLSGIAAAAGVRGGWPALYAANRAVVGPDPGLIRPGTTLTLPGLPAVGRYTVEPGDTLSGIAATAGVRGGWPALYAANRAVIGPDPDAIRTGTVLTIPRPAPVPGASRPASPRSPTSPAPPAGPTTSPSGHAQPPPTVRPGHESAPARTPATAQPSTRATAPAATLPSTRATAPAPATPPATEPLGPVRHPRTTRPTGQAQAPVPAGLPRWLLITLAAAGLLIVTAFLTEPVLALTRRRAARPDRPDRDRDDDGHIVLADYERLVVTHSGDDGTVYVLRPPGADPRSILLAARLVLAQDRYEALAGHLGIPAHWPTE